MSWQQELRASLVLSDDQLERTRLEQRQEARERLTETRSTDRWREAVRARAILSAFTDGATSGEIAREVGLRPLGVRRIINRELRRRWDKQPQFDIAFEQWSVFALACCEDALIRHRIMTLGQVRTLGKEGLRQLPRIGPRKAEAIWQRLHEAELLYQCGSHEEYWRRTKRVYEGGQHESDRDLERARA